MVRQRLEGIATVCTKTSLQASTVEPGITGVAHIGLSLLFGLENGMVEHGANGALRVCHILSSNLWQVLLQHGCLGLLNTLEKFASAQASL